MKVFISYAKENYEIANKLYNDLEKFGITPWIDRENLIPGQKWETEIRKAIGSSQYFLTLISSESVSKRGFVQKEQRIALDLLDEFVPDKIFIIPVSIDGSKPVFERLKELHWVDLSSYDDGFRQILRALSIKTPPFQNKPSLVKNFKKIIIIGIISIITVFLVHTGWNWRRPKAEISLEVVTRNVSMVLDEEWFPYEPFKSKEIFINKLQKIQISGTDILQNDTPEKTMEMELNASKGSVMIQGLKLDKNTDIELTLERNKLEPDKSKLKMFLKNTQIGGSFLLNNGNFSITNPDEAQIIHKQDVNSEMPENIAFQTAKTIGTPIEFQFIPEDWRIRGLYAKNIGFMEEVFPASGKFESAILSATLKLPETNISETFREGDRILIKDIINCSRLEISKEQKGIKVLFEGEVSEIKAGPPKFEKNLTPRWLEYIYNQQKSSFWSVIVAILALVWKFKDLFKS